MTCHHAGFSWHVGPSAKAQLALKSSEAAKTCKGGAVRQSSSCSKLPYLHFPGPSNMKPPIKAYI